MLKAMMALCAAAALALPVSAKLSDDPTVWPNKWSSANSDDWLIQHHDQIKTLKPRVLVLNFANNRTPEQARAIVDGIIAAVAESSRYHGYKDPAAPVTLQYEVAKFVDLADRPADPRPAKDRLDGNSTNYPRLPGWTEGINFVYSDLFTQRFAEHYGYRDPRNPRRFLTLEDLVDQGLVNEVWFTAIQGNFGSPFESIEVKQAYDKDFHKIPGAWKQAGNGGSEGQPWIGRSLRIGFINSDRGPGCFMESLSHSFEANANCDIIPYLTKYFNEYAGFDLDKRWGLAPGDTRLYGHGGDPVDYPDPSTMVLKSGGETITVHNYFAIGGNVHYNPTGRHDYDLDNPEKVMCTIEHYRLHDGPNGQDIQELWDVSRFKRYNQLAGDCMGPWLVYWRQNMPGPNSPAKDDDGKPMKSWWPFLFY
ncbi:MAG TPA: hypothetical protein VGM37_04640 [Armatimonadota bacterium]